jgi:hypothetical protein
MWWRDVRAERGLHQAFACLALAVYAAERLNRPNGDDEFNITLSEES